MRIPTLEGWTFSPAHRRGAPLVALASDAMARRSSHLATRCWRRFSLALAAIGIYRIVAYSVPR